MERGGRSSDSVFVVWNGPDLDRMALVKPEPELKRGRPHLLAYVGRMSIQDGVDYALYALHDLVYKRGRQDVSLVLMGCGDCLPQLQALAQELKLDEYVHFTGWVSWNDIGRYLAVADVGLSPDPQNGSNEYCTMIKVLEYMAMGKPIVAFDLAETRNTAQGTALYATPNLAEDFAHKIEILLDNEELRLDMGARGRRRIEEELSWEHAREHLLQAYARLLSRSSESLAALSGAAEQPARSSEPLAVLSSLSQTDYELVTSTIPE
jgi:glycosyltransferase involved in cell wall biosynthesis